MTDVNNEVLASDAAVFTIRYFIKLNSSDYVTGMMVAVSEEEAEDYISAQLQEVSEEMFESIGTNSKYVSGQIVQGAPQAVPLTVDDANIIKSSLLSQANTYTQSWQTQLMLGIITDADKASVTTWMKYYQSVQAIDTSTAPDIKWPEKP